MCMNAFTSIQKHKTTTAAATGKTEIFSLQCAINIAQIVLFFFDISKPNTFIMHGMYVHKRAIYSI